MYWCCMAAVLLMALALVTGTTVGGGGVVAGTVEAVLSDALALHGGAGAGTRH